MPADTSRLEIELDDKTQGQQQSLAGFIGFGPDMGLVSGLTNVHPAIAGIIGSVSALSEGLLGIKDSMLNMAQELRPYSGAVASAFALNEVDRINMLLERDAKMGEDLATLVRQQNEFDLLWQDIRTQIASILIPVVKDILTVVQDMLPLLKQFVENAKGWIEEATDWIVDNMINGIGQWAYKLWKARSEKDALEKANKHLEEVFSFLKEPPPPQRGGWSERNIPGGIF